MVFERKSPRDVARSLGERSRNHAKAKSVAASTWRRETFCMPRLEAREKAAYMTEIESWRELSDGQIEFTIRRLPTAD